MSRNYGWQINTKEDSRRRIISGEGAFGDLITAPLYPALQADFVYGFHEDLTYEYTFGTGSLSYADAMVALATGASQYGTAYTRSVRVLRYRPGQGALFRFTAIFDTPIAGVSQTAGCYGGSENGLHFGYDYTDSETRFGVNHQYGGVRTIYTLEIDTPAGGAETFTVTLNGTGTNVSLTSGTAADNAQEIADTAFSGWDVEADGSHVHFLADNVGLRDGAYSVSSTGVADGTFTENATGAAVTDTWTYQEDWNYDKFDGTGPSGITLDPTKGNVYQIKMQYLGFGAIDYGIEDPDTGRFALCHRNEYANANTVPSSTNPTYYVGAACSALSNAGSITMYMGSMAGFVEGSKVVQGPNHGAESDGSVSAAVPVLSIRNNQIFVDGTSKVNLRDIFPTLVTVSGSGSNKPVEVQVILNGTLTAPLWVNYDSTHAFSAVDSSATAITGGDLILSTSFASGSGIPPVDLSSLDVDLRPGDVLSIVVNPTGTAVDYVASIAWKEDA